MRNDLSIINNGFNLFDPFFSDGFFRTETNNRHKLLKCDVVENEKDYELTFDVPGVKKEDISLELEDGNLTIAVEKKDANDETKKNFVRKERYYYKTQRSFYVGNIKEENIKAKMENGELIISVPKEEQEKVTKKTISIE